MARSMRTVRAHRGQSRRGRGDGGAALLEFAFIAPVLFLLIFGMIDFGWLFFQNLDTRHAARETARLVATAGGTSDPYTSTAQVITEACSRIERDDVDIVITYETPRGVGSEVVVEIQQPFETLTGFSDIFIPVDELSSEVATRLEKLANATDFPNEPDEADYVDCA
jgi:hypothetical protein